MSWEQQKENIQPIPQGRKIEALMQALSLVTDQKSKKSMLEARKKQFDEELEECKDDLNKQLDLWHQYIDWLEQHVPEGGKVNGLTNAIEQCIEIFYNKNEFKQDERLFDIFMKFKRFCDEPAEIFGFMYANSIGTLLARFYLNWSWQYEIRKNMKRAGELLKLGLKNLATPRDVLEEAQIQLNFRLERMIRTGELDDCPEVASSNNREAQDELANSGIRSALQTLKFRVTKKQGLRVPINRTGTAIDNANVGGLKSQTKIVNGVRVAKKAAVKPKSASNRPVSILKETDENQAPLLDENGLPKAMVNKIPTAQRIRLVGRTGAENIVAPSKTLKLSQASVISSNHEN
uniref:Mitotic checkpoint serine/threonine-protein kinase BUB1 beta n=1 Tax=Aceria tosichella TaxID=561515 RepID=A0A6G1S8Z3_9ACAR